MSDTYYVYGYKAPDGSLRATALYGYVPDPKYLQRDSEELIEEFEARCKCEAALYYRKKYFDGEVYDMHFCREDKANGHDLCPYFEELSEEATSLKEAKKCVEAHKES